MFCELELENLAKYQFKIIQKFCYGNIPKVPRNVFDFQKLSNSFFIGQEEPNLLLYGIRSLAKDYTQ